jgi:hypothetical protein
MLATQSQMNGCNNPEQAAMPGFELYVLPRPKAPYEIRHEVIQQFEAAFTAYHTAAAAYNGLIIRQEERRQRALATLAADPESTVKIQPHPALIRHKMKLEAAYTQASDQLRQASADALAVGISAVDLVLAISEAIAEGGK